MKKQIKKLKKRIIALEQNNIRDWGFPDGVHPEPVPNTWPPANPAPPYPYEIHKDSTTPCMFDNLKPGVYGLSCPCPRCSTRSYSGVNQFEVDNSLPSQNSILVTGVKDFNYNDATSTSYSGPFPYTLTTHRN